jgi:hypothetical protein
MGGLVVRGALNRCVADDECGQVKSLTTISTPYNLIFRFHVDGFFGADSSDGVITLSSQLREEAQAGASMIHGYDEGHASILANDDAAKIVNALLDSR